MQYLLMIYIILQFCFWDYTLAVAPVISNLPNSTNVHEDTSTEVLIYALDVTDADGDSITCSFGPGTNPGSGSTRFNVRYITGTATWGLYTVAGANYDYSSQADYSLVVDCDANGDTATGTYIVYLVQNQAPAIQNLPATVTLSTSAAIGDNVFNVEATDIENDQITLGITCSPVTPTCPFQLFASGTILLKAGISTAITGYDVTVSVSDDSGSGTSKLLSVIFSGINDPPVIQNLGISLSIQENRVLGDTLVTSTCTDNDVADTLMYTMSCLPATGSTYFQINSLSGVITTSSASLINYEFLLATGSTSFTCTVTCNDGEATDTATVDFDVTDVNEAPVFAQNGYSLSVPEGLTGTALQSSGYDVTDEDASDTKTFSFDCGTSTGYFSIDTGTGITSYGSDYDVDDGVHPTSVTCNVTVTDTGGLSNTVALYITINNINDNVPVFSSNSYSWFISYSDPVSTSVGTVKANDADIGTFGDINYSLDQSSLGTDYFGVDQTGKVYIKNSIIPLGEGVTATFEVLATDGGGTETRVTATVVTVATTTVTTTTTTDRFKTFFDDGRNIAWLTACGTVLGAIVLVSVWMCCTYTGGVTNTSHGNKTKSFILRWCKWKSDVRPHRKEPQKIEPQVIVDKPKPESVGFEFWSTNNQSFI